MQPARLYFESVGLKKRKNVYQVYEPRFPEEGVMKEKQISAAYAEYMVGRRQAGSRCSEFLAFKYIIYIGVYVYI